MVPALANEDPHSYCLSKGTNSYFQPSHIPLAQYPCVARADTETEFGVHDVFQRSPPVKGRERKKDWVEVNLCFRLEQVSADPTPEQVMLIRVVQHQT